MHTRLRGPNNLLIIHQIMKIEPDFPCLAGEIVLDSRQKGRGFKPHWRHCVVVLEQDTFILA